MTGLLFVYTECGPDISETDFNDWYDNEHAPARLPVPGVINAVRYKAIDSKTPTWLAMYGLDNPSVATSPPYKALIAQASDRERHLISHLAILDRRIYQSYSVKVNPQNSSNVFPGKFILVVEMVVKPELDEEFNRWYEEEHIPGIAKVPGWHRARRYKLVNRIESKAINEGLVHEYLAIHEWSHDTYMDTPEFEATLTTPWSVKILKEVTASNTRCLAIHKDIQPI